MESKDALPSPALAAVLENSGDLGPLMPFDEAERYMGITRQGIYGAINRGELDRIPLSPRRSALLESQVKEWVRKKVEAAARGTPDERRQAVVEQRRAAAKASVAARKESTAKARAADARNHTDATQV